MTAQDHSIGFFAKDQAVKTQNKLSRACDRNNINPEAILPTVIKQLQDWLELIRLRANVPVRTTGKKLGRPRTVDALRNHFDYQAAARALELTSKVTNLSPDEQARAAWVRGLLLIPQDQLPTEKWTQEDINALAEWNIIPERFMK